jgi:tetratricopeptide (TPR) repeat protein
MKTLICALVLVLFCGVVTTAPATADAQDNKKLAKKHYRQGQTHYKLGRFPEALKSFSKAYEYLEHPAFLFNIAQCHRQLKNYERAVFFYEGYLRDKPDAPNRALVEELIADTQGSLNKQKKLAAAAARKKAQAEEAARKAAAAKDEAAREEAAAKEEADALARKEAEGESREAQAVPASTSSGGVSATGALARSAAVPGWGQIASGRSGTGYAFLGAAVVGVGAVVYSQMQATQADSFISQAGPLERKTMFNQAQQYNQYRMVAIGVLGAIWAGSAAEAYLGARRGGPRPARPLTVAPMATPDGGGLILTGRF